MKKRGFVNSILSKMRKRGLSTIVITLIIILISLVAVGIIWVVVRNVIQTGTKEVTIGQFTLDAKIKDVNIFNSSNNVSLIIKRNPGVGEFNKMNFVFSDGKSSEVITQPVSLNELEEKWFMFHLGTINVFNLISISIFPYVKQDEKEILGNILDKYTVSTQTSIIPICTPLINNYCSIQGYACGNWGNGSCFGNLNCGACGGATPVCNSSGKCVASCTPLINNYCSVQGYECGYWGNNSCSGNLSCGSCGSQATCPSGTCVCNSGWGDCNNDNTCECDLSSNSCSGGSCVVTTGYTCGNNLIEPGEACDGTNVEGYTCATVAAGFVSGTLTCNSDCKRYITSSCVKGNNITALSCSQTDVQSAINSANDGDTVNIPAGNCTWTSAVTITKGIMLRGAGINKTFIKDGTPSSSWNGVVEVTGTENKPFRISEISFFDVNDAGIMVYGTSKNWRIDHCNIMTPLAQWGGIGINVYATLPGYTYGLVDHCYIRNMNVADVQMFFDVYVAWNRPLTLGTSKAVYIEDCVFDNKLGLGPATDGSAGARWVLRRSKLTNSLLMLHGTDGGSDRGTHSYEFYSNELIADGTVNCYRAAEIRGGTGVLFNNTFTGAWGEMLVEHNCACDVNHTDSRCLGDKACTGYYPCINQIGRTTDSNNDSVEDLSPLYAWNNTDDGAVKNMGISSGCPSEMQKYIKENRDFFNNKMTYNPTTGIYNSTYTGDDNSTKQWTYRPYVYPHPLALI